MGERGSLGDRADRFWAWFAPFSVRLAERFQDPQLLDELDRRVFELDPACAWEVGPGRAAEHLLVISPDGRRDLLDVTEAIVDRAPVVPAWEFASARLPRRDPKEVSVLPNPAISVVAWRYVLYRRSDHLLDLVIEAPNLIDIPEDDRYVAAVVAVESLIGERERLRRVEDLEVVLRLPEGTSGNSNPLAVLARHLADMSSY